MPSLAVSCERAASLNDDAAKGESDDAAFLQWPFDLLLNVANDSCISRVSAAQISQEELERHDGVQGKYTLGLGQVSCQVPTAFRPLA